MISEVLQARTLDWLNSVDPEKVVSAENCVIKLIEECTEFLRADAKEDKLFEMADILMCAVEASSRVGVDKYTLYKVINEKINEKTDREYYVKNRKIMRLKDGKDH